MHAYKLSADHLNITQVALQMRHNSFSTSFVLTLLFSTRDNINGWYISRTSAAVKQCENNASFCVRTYSHCDNYFIKENRQKKMGVKKKKIKNLFLPSAHGRLHDFKRNEKIFNGDVFNAEIRRTKISL